MYFRYLFISFTSIDNPSPRLATWRYADKKDIKWVVYLLFIIELSNHNDVRNEAMQKQIVYI